MSGDAHPDLDLPGLPMSRPSGSRGAAQRGSRLVADLDDVDYRARAPRAPERGSACDQRPHDRPGRTDECSEDRHPPGHSGRAARTRDCGLRGREESVTTVALTWSGRGL